MDMCIFFLILHNITKNMFKYITYTNNEQMHYQLPKGYIQATGTIYNISDNIQNLLEEISKSPNGECISIVWENINYVGHNQGLWKYYSDNIVPHNFKPPNLVQDRTTFNEYYSETAMLYPNEGQVDFADLHHFINKQELSQIVELLESKNMTIFGSVYDIGEIDISPNVKSARSV